MYERDNIAIQNLQGEFIYRTQIKDASGISGLFANGNSCFLAPDDGIEAVGPEAIKACFESEFKKYGDNYQVASHTPAVNVLGGATIAKATWYAWTFEAVKTKGKWGVVQGCARFDADLIKESDVWKFKELKFYYQMTLDPVECKGNRCPTFSERFEINPHIDQNPDAKDFILIEHMMSRYCQNRRRGYEDYFVHSDKVVYDVPTLKASARGYDELCKVHEKLLAKEQSMIPYAMSVNMLASPWIRVGLSFKTAQASFGMLSLDMEMRKNKQPVIHIVFSQLLVDLVKADGEWKIERFIQKPMIQVPDNEFNPAGSEDTLFSVGDGWWDANEPTGNYKDSDITDILRLEEYVTFWVSGIRNRSEAYFYYNRLAIERPELLEYRVGLKKHSRGLESVTKDIFGMTSKFATYQPKSPGSHVGTTPVIDIEDDGLHARCTWYDYGWTTVAEVFGLKKPPFFANPAIGRYEMRFIKIDGFWKLYFFRWTPLYRMQKWTFDNRTTKGWCGTTSCRRFPLPYDRYFYENDPAKKGKKIVLEKALIDSPYEQPYTGPLDAMVK